MIIHRPTSPLMIGVAPIIVFSFFTSAVGPPINDVPVSAIAWQPPWQKTWSFTLMLGAERKKKEEESQSNLFYTDRDTGACELQTLKAHLHPKGLVCRTCCFMNFM